MITGESRRLAWQSVVVLSQVLHIPLELFIEPGRFAYIGEHPAIALRD